MSMLNNEVTLSEEELEELQNDAYALGVADTEDEIESLKDENASLKDENASLKDRIEILKKQNISTYGDSLTLSDCITVDLRIHTQKDTVGIKQRISLQDVNGIFHHGQEVLSENVYYIAKKLINHIVENNLI